MAKAKKSKGANGYTAPTIGSAKEAMDIGHHKLIQWVNDADDATLNSRELSEKSRDYYDSKQWTEEEKAKLKKQKQAATVRNRVKPKMDGLMGMERVNKTTAKAHPRTPKHEGAATAATEGIRFVLQDNAYNKTRSAAWENIIIEGTGGAEVLVEEKRGDFKIVINHIMWDRIIYDPHARRKDFSDARYLGQVLWMDYDEAAEDYPEHKDMLEELYNSNSTTYDDKPRWISGTRRRVKIVEMYYRQGGDVMYSCFTRGGYLKAPKKSPFINEEGETEWPYEFASPFVTRDGDRYGAVPQLLDIQDEINKRGSKALHLMSVRQVRWERGAVEDINKTRAELAKPDGVIETTPGMEFEILKTGDMAAAQFNLLAEAKQEIDAVSFSAAASGKETKNMSGIALRSREMASQTELAPMFDVLKDLDIRVYRKVWNRIRQYWKAEKWVRITDDENTLQFVGLNRKTTVGEQMMAKAQEQKAPPEVMQQLQMRMQMDPAMQQPAVENEIATLDVDIIIEDAPDSVTTQAEDFIVLGEMVKSGFQMPPIAVIEASPLSNKRKIIEMMKGDQQKQVPPEIQEQMQKMQEEGQKLQQENQALKQDQQGEMVKVQAKQQAAMAELDLKRQIQGAELQLERERVEATIILEREKAVAQLELERMKMDVNSDGDVDMAIQKVQNLVMKHEAKMSSMIEIDAAKRTETAEGEAEAHEESESAQSMATMHQQFIESVGQIIEALQSKKKVSMTMPDGRTATAEVATY